MGYIVEKIIKELRECGPLTFSKKTSQYILRHAINIINLPHSIFILRRFACNSDIAKLVDFGFSGCGGLISLSQVRSEIIGFLNLLNELNPKFILEIGTAAGGTLFLLSRIASEHSTIISIDLPGGPFGGGYPFYKTPLYKSFRDSGQQMYLIRANSHEKATMERIKSNLKDNKIDVLFIDGDHTYEGVAKDFEIYSPFVRKNGIIAFHDIVESPQDGYGVPKFWKEIKKQYQFEEFVENWDQGGFGIGVIKMA